MENKTKKFLEKMGITEGDVKEFHKALFGIYTSLNKRRMEELISEVRGKVKEAFPEEDMNTLKEGAGNLVEKTHELFKRGLDWFSEKAEKVLISTAKLTLSYRICQGLKEAGFSHEQSKEMAFAYLHYDTMTRLTQEFPDLSEVQLQQFVMRYFREHKGGTYDDVMAELMKPENREVLEDILKDIPASARSWYESVEDSHIKEFCQDLWTAYEADTRSVGEAKAFEFAKGKIELFV